MLICIYIITIYSVKKLKEKKEFDKYNTITLEKKIDEKELEIKKIELGDVYDRKIRKRKKKLLREIKKLKKKLRKLEKEIKKITIERSYDQLGLIV